MDVYAIDLSNKNINPLAQFDSIGKILNIFLPALMTGAAILLLVLLLWGGFMWITAGGSSENVAKAQKIMTYAVTGIILVVLSFLGVRLINMIFNIKAPI